jgi:hypothetical protein
MLFACELTDEGILFKPTSEVEEQIKLPAWAKANGETMGDAKTKSQARSERNGSTKTKGRSRPKPAAKS